MQVITATHDTAIMKDKNDTLYAHFANIDSYIEYNHRKFCDSCFDRSSSWTQKTNGEKMVELIKTRNMPEETMKRLNDAVELPDIERLKTDALTNDVVMSESGFMCDTNSFYAGEENCMINMDFAMRPSKTIWLASSIISEGGVEPDAMVNRGIALIRAVKTLQASGYNVGLVAYIHGSAQSRSLVTVVIKQPDEPLNENSVAAAFAHPSFFRTLGHNAVARLNDSNYGGMGSLPAPTKEQFEGAFLDESKVTILDGAFNYSDARTERDAVKWITNELNKALDNMGA